MVSCGCVLYSTAPFINQSPLHVTSLAMRFKEEFMPTIHLTDETCSWHVHEPILHCSHCLACQPRCSSTCLQQYPSSASQSPLAPFPLPHAPLCLCWHPLCPDQLPIVVPFGPARVAHQVLQQCLLVPLRPPHMSLLTSLCPSCPHPTFLGTF
jgi:hypothetical protein